MKAKTTIIALVPSNFDFIQIEQQNQIILSKIMKDKIYVLLDSITQSKLKKSLHINPYTYLNGKKLKYLYGDCYSHMIKLLIKSNIIESNKSYIVGKQSKGYRYTEHYRSSIPVIMKVNNTTLVKKLTKSNHINSSNYSHLEHFINGLRVDVQQAEKYIYTQYEIKHIEYLRDVDSFFRNQLHKDVLSQDVPKNPIFWLYHQLRSIYKLHNNQLRFKVDDTGYRLHTNLTNIKKELREFITYNGIKLVSVDYVNSQPLLSTILLKKSFWLKDTTINTINHSIIPIKDKEVNIIESIIKEITYNTYTMIPTFKKRNDSKELNEYTSLCNDGVLYEYLQSNLGMDSSSRKDVKSSVFQILFTDNRFIGQKEAKPKRAFRDLFPQVYRILSLVKRKNSKFLPILLQKIESEILLNRVAKRIEIEEPSLPIFTIHDSIVTTKGNELYIQSIMLDEMCKAIGSIPKTTIEYWTPDALNNNIELDDSVA